MKFVFRVDASLAIGSGHVMRCLTLADELSSEGSECHFVCEAGPGNLLEYIRQRGHATSPLPSNAGSVSLNLALDWQTTAAVLQLIQPDWLVVDHYQIDSGWETALRPYCRRILVIDDLADRPHDCDVLLDQNVYIDASDRYASLVPAHCVRFIGPEFALLRREFVRARSTLRPRRLAPPLRLHIFFGGSDPTGDTLRTLQCLRPQVALSVSIDVVIGTQNADREHIVSAAAQIPTAKVAIQVADMARHIAEADLAVGACGSAALERCSLGLPTLTLVTAENQRQLAAGLVYRGAIALLGDTGSVSDETLATAIESGLNDPEGLQSLGAAGMSLFPHGIDGARRVADLLTAQ